MSVEENVELMWRWFKEVWNEGRTQTSYDLLAPDAVAIGELEDGIKLRGPAEFVPFVARMRGAFPDIIVVIEDAFGAEDKVVLRWLATMTHHGDHLGITRHRPEGANHRDDHRSHCRQTDHRGMGQLGPARDAEADWSIRARPGHFVEERMTSTKTGRGSAFSWPSKVENQIAGYGKLVLMLTVVVGFPIPGTLEAQFWTQLHCCAEPMTPHDRVL